LSYIVHSLLLSSHLATPDLHSFPTRRSSDLDGRARVLADGLAEHLDHQVGEAVDDLRLVAEVLGRVHHAEHLDDALDLVEAAEIDRKSTRLNSSHGSISYAVFCLKKKTNLQY